MNGVRARAWPEDDRGPDDAQVLVHEQSAEPAQRRPSQPYRQFELETEKENLRTVSLPGLIPGGGRSGPNSHLGHAAFGGLQDRATSRARSIVVARKQTRTMECARRAPPARKGGDD